MSRIRSIKPEFWTSEQVLECSRNARLLFVGLWNFCDDLGRHPYSPKQAKAEVFPADDLTESDVDGMLQELSKNGLITTYDVENKKYFYVNGWKHQRIDKPQPAKYPDPLQEHSQSVPGMLPPDTIGRDTIVRERGARAVESISEASDLAFIILKDLGEDRDDPNWFGLHRKVEMWMNEKIPKDFILATCASLRGKNQNYLDKAVRNSWRERQNSPDPPRRTGNGQATGSVVDASRRLAERIHAFTRTDAPSVGTSGADVRLLPKG